MSYTHPRSTHPPQKLHASASPTVIRKFWRPAGAGRRRGAAGPRGQRSVCERASERAGGCAPHATRTVELVRHPAAVCEHRALPPPPRQQHVEEELERKPAEDGGEGLGGEEALAGGEARDLQLGRQAQAPAGVAGKHQAVADGRQPEQYANRPQVGPEELKVVPLLDLLRRRHGEQSPPPPEAAGPEAPERAVLAPACGAPIARCS